MVIFMVVYGDQMGFTRPGEPTKSYMENIAIVK